MLKHLWNRIVFFATVAGIVTTPLGAAEFIKTYGGPSRDEANSIVATADGGFAVAGVTTSFGAGDSDVWFLKLDASGNVEFEKTYGGSGSESATSMIQTADGSFAVAATTRSFGGGFDDLWVLKLDASGNVEFERTYGGPGDDRARSIAEMADGGIGVAGTTTSFGGGVFDNAWVLKLDATGNVVFEKTYDDPLNDVASAIVATADGGLAMAGPGSLSFPPQDIDDLWVLKLDASGNVEFERTYGGSGSESATSMVQTTDGGFAVAGVTHSFGAGRGDFWVLKLDATGNVVFEQAYGGLWIDVPRAIVGTADGGFGVAGWTFSFGANVADLWVLKLDVTGNVIFEKIYSGLGFTGATSIVRTADGGFGVAGITVRIPGNFDAWVLKLDGNGDVPACGLIQETHAIVTETAAAVQAHGVEGVPSNAIITDTAAIVTDTMSVVERQCGLTCEPRGLGFWKHQCSGQGFTQVPPTELADHFLTLEADSSVFPECALSGCAAFDGGGPKNDMRLKAGQQSLALELNIASGRLDLACPDDTDQTVEDVLAVTEPILCDAQAAKSGLETVKDLAEAINQGGDDVELLTTETHISGAPGTTWSVPVTLVNLSATVRSFSLAAQGRWHRPGEVGDSVPLEVALSSDNIPWLNAGDVEYVTLQVTIPMDAVVGESGSILLTALDVDSIPAHHWSLSMSVTAHGTSSP